jgi:ATP-dependent DNA ligase
MTKRARKVVAAVTSAGMPGFIKPQLATLKTKAPSGGQWLHEIKFDGYRVQVHLDKGKKRVFTRNGLDWTKRFSVIAGTLDISGQAISYLLGENDIGLPVIYSEHLTGDGQEMFEHAAKLNFEGIVSKNAQAPYRSDRNEGWLKIKTVQREDSRSSASSKIPPEWPRYTSESAREKISSTWARSGPAGREPSRARSENSLIPSSVRNQS